MALATRCPACETIFRISTAQAAVKGGMVRCGQCRNVFNSLDALVRVEDLDVLEDEADEASESPLSAATLHTDDAQRDSPSRDADTDVDIVESAAVSASEPIETDSAQQEKLASTAEPPPHPAEGAVFSEWWLPQNEPAIASPAASTADAAGPPSRDVKDFRERSLSDRRVSVEWQRSSKVREPEFMRVGAPRAERSRTERWMLVILSIAAALGIAAQAAYVWRNELAVRVPATKPWLIAACAPLRCIVDYPTHLDAITIESTALQSSGPNSNLYTLTALLRNRDAVTVRYPHLELTLTDTQDQPILRRALRPEDYLARPRGAAATTALAGGFAAESELPVRMMFELNDLRFVGYRLDKFYP